MKKNLILMSALFAGAMFMNDGFCANGGIPFDQTCDGVIDYVMRENSNRAITLQLRNIAQNPNWLDGLSQDDKIALRRRLFNMQTTEARNGYINTIITNRLNELIAPAANIVPNDEVQNHVVNGELIAPAAGIVPNDEVQNHAVDGELIAPAANIVPNDEVQNHVVNVVFNQAQDDRRRAHNEIEGGNDNGDGSYCVKRIKKIASKSKEKLHQAGEAVKPAIDYVKNNPAKTIGYSLGGVSIAKGIHCIYRFAKGFFGW